MPRLQDSAKVLFLLVTIALAARLLASRQTTPLWLRFQVACQADMKDSLSLQLRGNVLKSASYSRLLCRADLTGCTHPDPARMCSI